MLSIIAHAEYLALGLSGVLMTSLEWWSFELLGLGAGYLGVVSLATHNIMANVVVLAFMLSLGVSIGVRPLPPPPPLLSSFFLFLFFFIFFHHNRSPIRRNNLPLLGCVRSLFRFRFALEHY